MSRYSTENLHTAFIVLVSTVNCVEPQIHKDQKSTANSQTDVTYKNGMLSVTNVN